MKNPKKFCEEKGLNIEGIQGHFIPGLDRLSGVFFQSQWKFRSRGTFLQLVPMATVMEIQGPAGPQGTGNKEPRGTKLHS